MTDRNELANWVQVAAKALAFQSLHVAGLAEAPMVQKAQFLMALGLSRPDVANLIGSTDESLRVQLGRLKRKGATSGVE